MTLNDHFALRFVSGLAPDGLAFGLIKFFKTVRKFPELPIYCQRQKCSTGNVVSGSIMFMQIFVGVPWGGASNESGVVENNDFRFFRSLYLTNFHIQSGPRLL